MDSSVSYLADTSLLYMYVQRLSPSSPEGKILLVSSFEPELVNKHKLLANPSKKHYVWQVHSSENKGLCLMKSYSKMLQNLSYFIYLYENPKLLFPLFISCYFIFSPNECPGVYVEQILKHFAVTFHQA